jgi:acyl-CoA synthetase (AMP-forming)/AMP-acid ligase II
MLWTSSEGHVFYRSGDMGKLDEDGFLYILDRRKDMIISGGFNIYAVDLEKVLLEHPAVVDVAVIGIPSDHWGETPLCLVVRKPGATTSEPEILDWANERLGKTQHLAAIEFRDELPYSSENCENPTGKNNQRPAGWGAQLRPVPLSARPRPLALRSPISPA